MLKEFKYKKLVFVVISVVLVIVLTLVLFPTKNDTAQVLRSLGYNVEARNATFRGFTSQNISATKSNEQIMMTIVENVGKNTSESVLSQLNETLNSVQQTMIITDPYSGKQRELSLPDSLKPVREETTVNGTSLTYYQVYANDIFSLKIFSEAEATKMGIFVAYYCQKQKSAYSLEIFSESKSFDNQKQLSILKSLFCK